MLATGTALVNPPPLRRAFCFKEANQRIKVHILTVCEFCDGQAYPPVGPDIDSNGEPYTRYRQCTYSKGSGNREK